MKVSNYAVAPDLVRVDKGVVYMLGVGPGDPELVTVKAARLMKSADIVYVPESDFKGRSVAEIIVSPYTTSEQRRGYLFPMTNNRQEVDKRYAALASEIQTHVEAGKRVVYVTLGDSMLYSTAQYVAQRLDDLGVAYEYVAGVPSYVACANISKVPLGERQESFTVQNAPATAEELNSALQNVETVVLMKVAKRLDVILDYVKRYNPSVATLVRRATLEDEEIIDLIGEREIAGDAGYLAVVIVKR